MNNLTEIELDPFEDVNLENSTEHLLYESVTLTKMFICLYEIFAILKFLACVVNVGANIFLMRIIHRFKKLRTRSNFYIFNYALANTIFTVPFFIVMFQMIFEVDFYRVREVFCMVLRIEECALFLSLTFSLVLGVDWYVVSFKSHYVIAYKKFYRWLIYIIYAIGVVKYLVDFVFCLKRFSHFSNFFSVAVYVFYIVCIVLLNYLIKTSPSNETTLEQLKTKYCITVSNFVILSWLPLFCYHVLFDLFEGVQTMLIILEFTHFFPDLLVCFNTAIILCLLGRMNKHFKMAYRVSFKRSLKDYEHEDLDKGDSDDEATVTHTVNNSNSDNNWEDNRRIISV